MSAVSEEEHTEPIGREPLAPILDRLDVMLSGMHHAIAVLERIARDQRALRLRLDDLARWLEERG